MRRVIALVAALALVMVIPVAAQAVKPEQFKVEGGTAFAFWVEEGEETFKFADAFLTVGEMTVGGDSFFDVFFDIFIGEFGPDGFVDLFGFAVPGPDEYTLDVTGGSFSASVEVEVELMGQECTFGPSPFPDCVPIGPFFATVAIEWDEATGRIYPSIVNGRFHSPFGFDSFRQKTLARTTVATGAISGDIMMDLGTSEDAGIGRDSFVDRFRFTAL